MKRALVLFLSITGLLSLAIGSFLVWKLIDSRTRHEADMDGLRLKIETLEWLVDQMEHHENFPMPASMMPDLPPPGVYRLNLEVGIHNASREVQTFRPGELYVRSSSRGMWPAQGADVLASTEIGPGEVYIAAVRFDIAEKEIEEGMNIHWVKNRKRVRMLPVPPPPEHLHPSENLLATDWPIHVSAFPEGDPKRGNQLYRTTFGCVSCHGHPDLPNSQTLAPSLLGISQQAAERMPGISAAQYLYRSLIEPDEFVAPDCNGQPCATPSTMPPMGDLISLEDMPDLIAYLLEL